MSEDRKMSRRDEIETLLPFYLGGSLSGKDLADVEDWLANDPAAEAALLAAEAELDLIAADNEALRPHPEAFKRFAGALEKEAGPAVPLASRLKSWLGQTFSVPAPLVWASAAAMLALAVVTGVIQNRPASGDIEIAGSGDYDDAVFVLAAFKPEARMEEISGLLRQTGGRITDGPGATGLFKIIISAATPKDYDAVLAQLSASPLIASVTPGRRPDAGGQ